MPQTDFLSIIYTGNKKGIVQYKSMATSGSLGWKLKDFIDRRFMNEYKFYEQNHGVLKNNVKVNKE